MAERDLSRISGAQFSPCRLYRYSLWRTWDAAQGHLMFIGLNPSTADEHKDDPTIRRCKGFAARSGYGGILMLNLFALRATNPRELLGVDDPVGPQNDEYLRMCAESSGRIVGCWGAWPAAGDRAREVVSMLDAAVWCLGVTKAGWPRHPLYLPNTAELAVWKTSCAT